jgi:hypothetical protein
MGTGERGQGRRGQEGRRVTIGIKEEEILI